MKMSRADRNEAVAKASAIKKVVLGEADRDCFLSALSAPPLPTASLQKLFLRTTAKHEGE